MAANKTSDYTLCWWEKIVYAIVMAILYCFSILPMCIHYFFSDIVYFIVYRIVRYRVGLVRKNLAESFPEKTEQERRVIEQKFYHFLGDYVVETIKLLTISQEQMKRRMKFRGLEHINDVSDQGLSVAVYLGHYCNWEWITSLGLFLRPNCFVGQIYHVLENKVFDKVFLRIRQRMGSICVPMADILRKRIECKRSGTPMVMGYIADQVPFWNNIHYWTPFLNHDTPVLTGAEKLSKRFGDAAIYLDISRPRRGYYEVDIVPLTQGDTSKVPDFEITEAYFRALEKTIQRQPELWLWTHNRWKRTREEFNKMYGIEE